MTKPHTKLQSIASERNWLLNFVLSRRCLQPSRHLELRSATYIKCAEVNKALAELRYLIDLDWREQRKLLKREGNKPNG